MDKQTLPIEIVESTFHHCRELTKTLREEDKLEAIHIGVAPAKAVFSAHRGAFYRKTALVDDKVAAMWGVHGSPLGRSGMIYLITGTEALKVSPLRFARVYMNEVSIMKEMFPVLENYVDAEYTGAVRLLKMTGFTLKEQELINGHYFRHFYMIGRT